MDQTQVFAIDDDPAVLDSLRDLLTAFGFSLRCFDRPTAFLASLPGERCGCVITDFRMPEMSGLELLRAINRTPDWTFSVVFVTAYANVPLAVDIMQNGAITVLEKPYTAGTLVTSVRHAIQLAEERYAIKNRQLIARQGISALTYEERTVLELAVAGLAYKAIAQKLGISQRTVDRRLLAAREKLHVQTIPECAAILSAAQIHSVG